ncbi:MAG: 4Fe-4S double cluster binding domain-containing protein [Lentisphaeria bacterium]
MASENRDFYSSLSQQCGALQTACLSPELVEEEELHRRLQAWFDMGHAGLLPFMDRRAELLGHPFGKRKWAQSLLLISFLPQPDLSSSLLQLPESRVGRPSGCLAAYVLNEDYHLTGRGILRRIVQMLGLSEGEYEIGVDAGPLLEKSLAVAAGLGCYGFNTLLRTESWGTQVHLGYLFSAKSLPPQRYQPLMSPACLECQLCLKSCPNQALSVTDGLRLRFCRSWLAGEKKGSLSWQEQKLLGAALAGCSICSCCCPGTAGFSVHDRGIDVEALCQIPTGQLERILHGTVLQHIGPVRLKRNAVAALGTQLSAVQRKKMQQQLLPCCNSESIRQTLMAWPL